MYIWLWLTSVCVSDLIQIHQMSIKIESSRYITNVSAIDLHMLQMATRVLGRTLVAIWSTWSQTSGQNNGCHLKHLKLDFGVYSWHVCNISWAFNFNRHLINLKSDTHTRCHLKSDFGRGGKNFFPSGNLGLGLKNFCKNFTRQVCKITINNIIVSACDALS